MSTTHAEKSPNTLYLLCCKTETDKEFVPRVRTEISTIVPTSSFHPFTHSFSLTTLFMAITSICSSPTHSSPTLPTISALKTHHPLQLHVPVSSSSTKFGSNLVSNDALVIAAAAQAVALARAASQAARDAVLAAAESGEVWSGRESDNGLVKGVRRRRRKNWLEEKNGISSRSSSGSVKSRKLSRREEAELCLCLKVCQSTCKSSTVTAI
jgi:hypothetical protein